MRDNDLETRCFRAYFRAADKNGWTARQPTSGVTEYRRGGRDYAVLENSYTTLAVFRVHKTGRLTGVPEDRWTEVVGKGWR